MHQGGNSNALTQMYSNLVRRNPADGVKEIVPELATDWEISDSVTQYDFSLREGVKFTDGSDFTAELNRTLDADARAALFRRGEDILDADSPAVPLGWISHQLMWRNDVKGLTLDRRAVVEWGRIETVWRHVLRNALLPVITVSGLQFASLLGGSVAVERAFSVPGLGTALVQGITERDWMLIQNLVLLYAIIFVLINLIIDLTYSWIDPRIRYQ